MPITVTAANFKRIAAELCVHTVQERTRDLFLCGAQVLEVVPQDAGSRHVPAVIQWMSGESQAVPGVKHVRIATSRDQGLPSAECVMAVPTKPVKSRHPHPIHRRAVPVRR
jgi:hypothetical protein